MLREMKTLHGWTIHARDGEIGRIDEILFDDAHWTVRYLIVDIGNWLFGRKVLISPLSFGQMNWAEHTLSVNLTGEMVEKSPNIETDEPVSRQYERDYYDFYAMPYYWGGMGLWGAYSYPSALALQPVDSDERRQPRADDEARDNNDAHLRSARAVSGYKISATDGHLGHVQDFIIDDETWRIRYLAVDTRDWWPGKKVLLTPDWIRQIEWPEGVVAMNVTREQVQNAPEWDSSLPIDHNFQERLDTYYGGQRPAANDATKVSAQPGRSGAIPNR